MMKLSGSSFCIRDERLAGEGKDPWPRSSKSVKRQGWMYRADWKDDGLAVSFDTLISDRSMHGKLAATSARM